MNNNDKFQKTLNTQIEKKNVKQYGNIELPRSPLHCSTPNSTLLNKRSRKKVANIKQNNSSYLTLNQNNRNQTVKASSKLPNHSSLGHKLEIYPQYGFYNHKNSTNLPQNQSKITDPYAHRGLERRKRDFTMHSNQIIQPTLNLQPLDSLDYHEMTSAFFITKVCHLNLFKTKICSLTI